jgi:hypothetical protein
MGIQQSVYIKYLQLSLKVEVRFIGCSMHYDTKGGKETLAVLSIEVCFCEGGILINSTNSIRLSKITGDRYSG